MPLLMAAYAGGGHFGHRRLMRRQIRPARRYFATDLFRWLISINAGLASRHLINAAASSHTAQGARLAEAEADRRPLGAGYF